VTRVVLDTNVLVAAASNLRSASRRIVEACLKGELTAVLSPALRREYEFILGRAVHGRPYRERLQQLLDMADVVVPDAIPRVVPDDPDDDKLAAVALTAGAVLVTNDAHLLSVVGYEGRNVARPSDWRW
jgi:putative PIN family toxin of toxin-antitoxin system